MFDIRRIRASEGLQLRAIRLRALREDPAAFSSTHERELRFSAELWETRAQESSEGPMAATFVALDPGNSDSAPWLGLVTVLGVGHPALGDSDAGELVSMWCAPETRRQGIGEALVKRAIAFAAENDWPSLELSVLTTSDGARRLYGRLGFKICPERALPGRDACGGETRMRHPLRLVADSQ